MVIIYGYGPYLITPPNADWLWEISEIIQVLQYFDNVESTAHISLPFLLQTHIAEKCNLE